MYQTKITKAGSGSSLVGLCKKLAIFLLVFPILLLFPLQTLTFQALVPLLRCLLLLLPLLGLFLLALVLT